MPSAAKIAALRLPFGLPFGREHFVVIQILCKPNAMKLASIAEAPPRLRNAQQSVCKTQSGSY